MIFSGFTSFHVDLSTYLQTFNISDCCKKVIFIDDVFGATQQEVRRMLPKASCGIQKYRKKNEGDVDMKEYSEVFTTSNQKAPLHMKPNSRRQLMLQASELKLMDRDFFSKMKCSTRDLDIAKAWFDFFKHRNIDKFSPEQNPDTGFRGEVVEACMVKSHIFLTRFLADPEWFSSYKHDECTPTNWVKAFEFKVNSKQPHRGERRLRITQKRLYYLYKRYLQEYHSSSKTRDSDTVWDELKELGIIKHAKVRRVNNKQTMVCDLYYSDFLVQVHYLYPGLDIIPWAHNDWDEFNLNVKKYMSYGINFDDFN
jgi:hypothetical protein